MTRNPPRSAKSNAGDRKGVSENASRDALSGRIGLFGRAIRPARSTTRGSEAEIAWKVAFGCFSLTGGKPNGECRFRERTLVSVSGIAGGITFSTLTRYPHKHPQFGGITSDANKQHRTKSYRKIHITQAFSDVFGAVWIVKWCPHTDSNRGPTDYKSVALPAEL